MLSGKDPAGNSRERVAPTVVLSAFIWRESTYRVDKEASKYYVENTSMNTEFSHIAPIGTTTPTFPERDG
jgi:hypothetical protein